MNQDLPKSFFDLIATHDKPILVDFWAEWCGPCKMLSPVIQELAAEWKGKVTVIKINTDDKPNIAGHYSISSIPTVILFKNGKEVKRISGAMPLQQLKNSFGPFI
ncbi:MAG TPA: thioredoxin [Leptospiraceae bacterium]|nr:thioredoxin [Leptospiraceae bacterium]HMW03665.1 thioredoxin [Leptospiraceae bacterium]HMX31208.1 thioredoxin [Leptospiraceae bacterium]HMY29414.1 thioredoxin [Leptospiraceae bacterium]HMZ67340.1 thioredoxin [Leptospiraceae bacterium]